MKRLLVVANRLPISIGKKQGEFNFTPSTGGLAVGLSSLPKSLERIWIGWPGINSEQLGSKDKKIITDKLAQENCLPVFLSRQQFDDYYLGFCNKTIWPLFHYFFTSTEWEDHYWQAYKKVNNHFCKEVLKAAQPGDYIWIHDYQLMLLPELLREKMPELEIGFFLHIPWPSFELFRLLPWREEILNGILGADLIGFHTYDYVRHFLSSACRIVGLEHNLGKLQIHNRIVKVDAFPMGIDYDKYANAHKNPNVLAEMKKIIGTVGKRKIIISIDRLDYTKGIIERLDAFGSFLAENPQYKNKVTLIMVAVPSRTDVNDYQLTRRRLEHLVGHINGESGSIGYMPVWYLYRKLAFHEICALYNLADVALVTPLRDGMNLIAKEFIASRNNGQGVLILGEMTGAASELGEALIVNVNNKSAIIQAIIDALEMPIEEQIERNTSMQNRIRRYDITRWSHDFIDAISDIKKTQKKLCVHMLSDKVRHQMITRYSAAAKRLFLLDYDGTLVRFREKPVLAWPDQKLINTLNLLTSDPGNTVVIISGRDKDTLEKWLGGIGLDFVAEHGAWLKFHDKHWEQAEIINTTDWKEAILPILELYSDRTPGSFVEEKDYSLVWHCRRSEPELAHLRTQELRGAILELTANLDIGVFEGHKILEIRQLGINKGRTAERWIESKKWDFILAAGDDYTDEELFDVLPKTAYSIKVGTHISKARFNISNVTEMKNLLEKITGGN